MSYESVIGLEVHVQVKTESKLFCSCPAAFGAPPNTNVCPVCCGHPGTLPVLNRKAVEGLVKTGLALHCEIRRQSVFARKQYFYPDLPKNYQISQYEKPLAEHGHLDLEPAREGNGPGPLRVGITRIHLEEDAGKLVHAVGSLELEDSLVDLNRAGVPLMEIVSEPDLRSPEQAQDYLTVLKRVLEYLGVSDCDMEKGSLRCDANISIRPQGSREFGKRVELKNMNSFRGVRDAVAFEIERQIRATEAGERIVQETRLWDQDRKESRPMRSKEEAHDYRYFPEPDLLPLLLEDAQIEALRRSLPELPAERKARFKRSFGLSDYDAGVLTSARAVADFFEETLGLLPRDPARPLEKALSNWITTELLGRLNKENRPIETSPVEPKRLAKLLRLIADGTISGKIAKTVFEALWTSPQDPEAIVKEKGLIQVLDGDQIAAWAETAIAQNARAVEEYRGGKERAIGALVGQVMKLSKGQANPEMVNKILTEKLRKT